MSAYRQLWEGAIRNHRVRVVKNGLGTFANARARDDMGEELWARVPCGSEEEREIFLAAVEDLARGGQ